MQCEVLLLIFSIFTVVRLFTSLGRENEAVSDAPWLMVEEGPSRSSLDEK